MRKLYSLGMIPFTLGYNLYPKGPSIVGDMVVESCWTSYVEVLKKPNFEVGDIV